MKLPLTLRLSITAAHAQVNVWTHRYNDARTGANLSATPPNSANYSPSR